MQMISLQIHPPDVHSRIEHLCVYFSSSDIVQLEQDTVLGVESILMLCSQDSSPSAQTTLKVRHYNTSGTGLDAKPLGFH